MANISEALAFHIKRLRKELGWSQSELAEKLGTHRNSIIRYESGSGSATFETISKLAEIFDVDETSLVTDPEVYKFYRNMMEKIADALPNAFNREREEVEAGSKERINYIDDDGTSVTFSRKTNDTRPIKQAIEEHKEKRKKKERTSHNPRFSPGNQSS